MVSHQNAQQVQRNTFYLIGCERCGRFEPPPPRTDSDLIADAGPLRCQECGELLLLLEGFLADETRPWQERPGAMWQHVAYSTLLPTSKGRAIWMKA